MNIHDLDTPALIADLDVLERNIRCMADLAAASGKRLRPHVKTHKTPEIARLQVDAGACGLTVAKPGEAAVMLAAGFQDILIANEIVDRRKLERIVRMNAGARVAVAVDGLDGVAAAAAEAARQGIRMPVRIEVDAGLHRAGVRTPDAAAAVARAVADALYLELEGVFAHEGHVYRAAEADRAAACAAAADVLRVAAEAIRAAGIPCDTVSAGSTPGARFMAAEHGITELRPGVYAFNDRTQVGVGAAVPADCALSVLAAVVSTPEPGVAIIDAGTKALSGDRGADGSPYGAVVGRAGIAFDWASEEHGHLDLSADADGLRVGDRVRIVPHHACACTNMHTVLYGVRGERVEAIWRIAARGMFV